MIQKQTFTQVCLDLLGIRVTRSATLIFINEEMMILAWQLTLVSLMLAPTDNITHSA